MKFDLFLSICQTEVDGFTPSNKEMFQNFFDQAKLADELEYGTAWVAETHLSCQTQKRTSMGVVPEFKGEIGLNTDILQLAQAVFSQTKNINVGSAIRNILCNGGPVAHAEAIRTFLNLQQFSSWSDRKLEIGFASGRFDFSNAPYGIKPRNEWEKVAWPVLKGKILSEAVEIFMRLLKGEELESSQVEPYTISRENFRTDEHWEKTLQAYGSKVETLPVDKFYVFEVLKLIPEDVSLDQLQLTIGTHDQKVQELANNFLPTRVFNLSITPPKVIEATHERMKQIYHKDGGAWQRDFMPRTAMVFMADTDEKAKAKAENAWVNYWKAMAGTLDQKKIDSAVQNAIYGTTETVTQKIKEKYHADDKLMLWFDFNNHDNADVKKSMIDFKEKVVPALG